MYPITVIEHKSLFQLVAEKVVAASKQAGRALPLTIMTSPQNDAITRRFFADHGRFGLDADQLSFFCQGQLPFLNKEGNLFLESPTTVAQGPNGNGFCFKHFAETGLLSDWISKGIAYLNVVLVDNPLADPFDAELIGFHHQNKVDVTIKCTEKKDPDEKVGVIVKQNGHTRVCEYSEMPESERKARQTDGMLKHRCANLSLFCFSLSFVEKVSRLDDDNVPLHKAWKAAKNIAHPEGFKAWKFEAFIFDLLTQTDKIQALLYPREECFAPLKNGEGRDSPETVQSALQEHDRRVFAALTGVEPPMKPFELSPEFYYPTPAFQAKWRGKSLPNHSYITDK